MWSLEEFLSQKEHGEVASREWEEERREGCGEDGDRLRGHSQIRGVSSVSHGVGG